MTDRLTIDGVRRKKLKGHPNGRYPLRSYLLHPCPRLLSSPAAPLPAALCQVFVCQMRDIESSWVVSTVGASASFTFSFIAVGLCIDRMAGGEVYGTVRAPWLQDRSAGWLAPGMHDAWHADAQLASSARHPCAPRNSGHPSSARPCRPQVGGVLYASTADKVFNVMNALGTIGWVG